MAQSETVAVNLNVNLSGFDKTIQVMDKTTKAFSSAEKSVSAFNRAIEAGEKAVENIKKVVDGAGKAYNWLTDNLGEATAAAVGLTVATNNQNKVLAFGIGQLLGKVIPGLTLVLTAYQAVKGAVSLYNRTLELNTEAQLRNYRTAETGERIYNDLARALIPYVDWIGKSTNAVKEWFQNILVGTDNAEAYRREINALANEQQMLEEQTLKNIRTENARNQALLDVQNALRDETLTQEQRRDLLEQERDAKEEIIKAELELQRIRVNIAAIQAADDSQDPAAQAAAVKQLAIEEQKYGAIKAKIDQNILEAQIAINAVEDDAIEKVEKLTQSLSDLQIEAAEFNEYLNELLDGDNNAADKWLENWQNAFDQTKAQWDIQLDDIEQFADEEEVVLAEMGKAQEKAARNRIKWQEFGFQGAVSIASSAFQSLSRLSGENFENQKAFATAGAVVDTAGGIARALREPGWPLAAAIIPTIALAGAAQIAAINQAQPGQQGTPLNPIVTSPSAQRPIGNVETAAADFYRVNQSRAPEYQAVLVTEDLDAVNNRVAVTEDRSTL